MTAHKVRNRVAFGILIFVCLQLPYPVLWISFPIRGQVLDKVTSQGIGGAVIVANWELEGGLIDNHPLGSLKVVVVSSDANGNFVIPSWGPRFHFGLGSVSDNSPTIKVVRAGYMPGGIDFRASGPNFPLLFVRNRAIIKLADAAGDPIEYARALDDVKSYFAFALSQTPCAWRDMAPFLRVVDGEWNWLRGKGLQSSVSLYTDTVRSACHWI